MAAVLVSYATFTDARARRRCVMAAYAAAGDPVSRGTGAAPLTIDSAPVVAAGAQSAAIAAVLTPSFASVADPCAVLLPRT